MSALNRITDLRHPTTSEKCQTRKSPPKQKAARRRLLNSNLMMVDQAAINAGFGALQF